MFESSLYLYESSPKSDDKLHGLVQTFNWSHESDSLGFSNIERALLLISLNLLLYC